MTGTSGFIGTNLCEAFHSSRRYDIIGVDSREPRERWSGVEYVALDLTNREGLQQVVRRFGPQMIVHLAAQARVEPSLSDPIGTYRANVVGTINLLEAASRLDGGLDRFVYASSETVYGPADTYPTKEDVPLRPLSAYASSKAACEMLVRNAHGIRSIILRSAMGYGPRSNPSEQVVAKFLAKALRDEPILFPTGLPENLHPTRDVNYVGNYVEAVARAINSGVEGTFNVGSGEEVSVLDLARRIVSLVGSGSIRFDPRFAYRPGEAGLRTWLDTRRAEAAFGYRPAVQLTEGLRRTLAWLREHPGYFGSEKIPAIRMAH